ncbi:MAG TPA: class I SAM-dependent methyltransferase [Puia sp.]|jgi:hypothetical protein
MDLKEIALNKSQKRHPWELARIKVIKSFIRNHIRLNDKDSLAILDVGSGDTYLIRDLSREFSNASFFAIDIGYDDAYIEQSNKEFKGQGVKIEVFNSQDKAEKTLSRPADLVLLLDVIEHVPDDVVFLRQLAASAMIDNNTTFLITVPAYQSLFCSHDVFLGHYRRYDNKMLRENVGKAGLKVLHIGYFFTFLLLPRYLQVARERKKKVNEEVTGIGNWEGSAFVSSALTATLWLDFSISSLLRKGGVKLPGLSNFAVCKKSV